MDELGGGIVAAIDCRNGRARQVCRLVKAQPQLGTVEGIAQLNQQRHRVDGACSRLTVGVGVQPKVDREIGSSELDPFGHLDVTRSVKLQGAPKLRMCTARDGIAMRRPTVSAFVSCRLRAEREKDGGRAIHRALPLCLRRSTSRSCRSAVARRCSSSPSPRTPRCPSPRPRASSARSNSQTSTPTMHR